MKQVKPSAVVIGAGFSGMASALILSMHGYKVSLVERAKKPGMTLRGFFRSRVYFDSGLHFVGELSEKGLLSTYLRYLGMGDIPCVDFDQNCFESIRFTDGSTFSMPIGYEAMINSMVSTFPSEERGILDYMKEMRAAYNTSAFHALHGPINSGDNNPNWQISLKDFIAARIHDNRLRTVLSLPCLYYGVSPTEATFLQHARVAGTHFDSVRTFECGGLSLVKACEKRMAEEDVDVLCGLAVTKITCSTAGTLSGVTLDNGEHIGSSVVIYTGHPAALSDILPDGALREASKKRLRNLHDTISAHILYMSTESNPPTALDKKNVFVCRHDEPFDRAFDRGRRLSDGPFYVMSGPSVLSRHTDELGAGYSKAIDYVAVVPGYASEYAAFSGSGSGKRPLGYRDLKQRKLSEFSEALFKACPDFSGLKIVDGATPLTLQKYLNTPNCGLYGAAHCMSQFNPLPMTRVPNLFIAGQAVAAPGIIGSLISAFLACGFVAGHEALLNEVRSCR